MSTEFYTQYTLCWRRTSIFSFDYDDHPTQQKIPSRVLCLLCLKMGAELLPGNTLGTVETMSDVADFTGPGTGEEIIIYLT